MSIFLVAGLSGCGKSTIIKHLCRVESLFARLSFSEYAISFIQTKFGVQLCKTELPSYLSQEQYYAECVSAFAEHAKTLSRDQCVLIDSGASANHLSSGLHFPNKYGFGDIQFDGIVFVKSRPSEILRRVKLSAESHRMSEEDEYFVSEMQVSLEMGMFVRAHSIQVPIAVILNSNVEESSRSLQKAVLLCGAH